MPLDCELRQSFQFFGGGTGWDRIGLMLVFSPCGRLEPARVEHIPSPAHLGSDKNTSAG